MITEYTTMVAACPSKPVISAAAILGFGSSSSPVTSSYRSYPRRSLCDGGGKEFFFMIIHPIQKTEARSGMAQINDFFATSCRSSGAGMGTSNFRFFCTHPRPLPGRKKDKILTFPSSPDGPQSPSKKSFFLNYFSRPGSELYRNIFNNLVNPLPTQIEFICNLPERRPGRTHLQNFGISIRISRWTRLQRAPLPAVNSLDGRCALFRKLIFSASLAHVSNPSSQCDIRIINNFDMHGGYIAITLPCGELRKGFDIGIESSNIVHKPQISTTPGASRKQLTFNYLLRQNLTSGTRASKLSKSQGGNA